MRGINGTRVVDGEQREVVGEPLERWPTAAVLCSSTTTRAP